MALGYSCCCDILTFLTVWRAWTGRRAELVGLSRTWTSQGTAPCNPSEYVWIRLNQHPITVNCRHPVILSPYQKQKGLLLAIVGQRNRQRRFDFIQQFLSSASVPIHHGCFDFLEQNVHWWINVTLLGSARSRQGRQCVRQFRQHDIGTRIHLWRMVIDNDGWHIVLVLATKETNFLYIPGLVAYEIQYIYMCIYVKCKLYQCQSQFRLSTFQLLQFEKWWVRSWTWPVNEPWSSSLRDSSQARSSLASLILNSEIASIIKLALWHVIKWDPKAKN